MKDIGSCADTGATVNVSMIERDIRIKMKTYFIILLAIAVSLPAAAQKAFRPVKTYLKAKNGKDALAAVTNLESDGTVNGNPRLYQMGMQAYGLINDVENEKIYLKQNFDTLSLFSSTYGIFEYALKCDSAESLLLAEKKQKAKYRKENAPVLVKHYPNLKVAANYFYTKKNYKEAARFYSLIINMTQTPVWESAAIEVKEKELINCACRHLCSSYHFENYEAVETFKELALQDTAQKPIVLEYLAKAALAQNDTVRFISYLKQGLAECPQYMYFFTNLADYHAQHNDYKEVLGMADTLLQADSTNLILLEAKSLALLNLCKYEESIGVSNKCLDLDSTLHELYFYIGASYCNLASEVELPTNINSIAYRTAYSKRKSYYQKARPFMEKYRQLEPDNQKQWATLLYNIYLNLNLGKEFEEIDTLLNKNK